MKHNRKISVIGLGYVGLPVAVAFAKQDRVIGFDIETQRIVELNEGYDRTNEVVTKELQGGNIQFTNDPSYLRDADFHIIAVPTPVDENKQPNLLPVLKASKTLGSQLKLGDIVVYESTVYPGATEEVCVPVLERYSGLCCGVDFSIGYSPERINPGDKAHNFTNVIKVVSGLNKQTLDIVASVYKSVVTAGVHCAPSIKIAEAAKVIENTQRDVNIALMNELAMIFNRMDIDTSDVLAAAGTKWNFLPFTPGLVGGHCIGVDPYYLSHKAEQLGYTPQIIPAARHINEGMGEFIAHHVLELLKKNGYLIQESIVTILGISFKENVPDLRNTRILDIVQALQQHNVTVQIHDPLVDVQEVMRDYAISLNSKQSLQKAQCVVLAVPHQSFVQAGWTWLQSLLEQGTGIVIDVKDVLPRENVPEKITLWRL
ncbi:nucleotide sugar dehydrogenase [Candidatus Parabeggiatoa sp. HSG14]|uniref:nucleotide sugar dehydrogenase n=1 Tax=Candidatus Parabeggiatoa sp. HSG14 TaxID=3055593 RepID=UPI0025A90D32|nr:nucleotide sugar dehydrogenase [Thiotrichales bacterium HSG14]